MLFVEVILLSQQRHTLLIVKLCIGNDIWGIIGVKFGSVLVTASFVFLLECELNWNSGQADSLLQLLMVTWRGLSIGGGSTRCDLSYWSCKYFDFSALIVDDL